MDPFTQRMLERAKARREKLDTQLSNAGHNVKLRRSPLKETNAVVLQSKSLNEDIGKISTEHTASEIVGDVALPGTTIETINKIPEMSRIVKEKSPNKENFVEDNSSNVRSKLKRMGKLYSNDCDHELSSPIHRTEEKFSAEEDNSGIHNVKRVGGVRLERLAALASTINNWEDDLSHPSVAKKGESKAEKIQAKMNEQVKGTHEAQPGTSGYARRWKSNSNEGKQTNNSTKQLKWDKSIIKNLEAQGYTRTKSNSRLVYDYKACSQDMKDGHTSQSDEDSQRNGADVKEGRDDSSAHLKLERVDSPSASRNGNRFGGYNGSPKNKIQSPGSVLSKASLFESKSIAQKTKDPAEMTLSERMALFEKNKGEALIPKAPLTLSVPTKKLQENPKNYSQNGGNKTAARPKVVMTGRALFEQGTFKQEMENDILRDTYTERQKELEMLRSRFNKNKEVAQAAAGSCIRARNNSETNNGSPKNSPVCPVRPTPATEHIPPPPPLPTSSKTTQVRGSPIKRQVADNAAKPTSHSTSQNRQHQHESATSQTFAAVKRIRISPPKPGHLYPDLTNFESSETDTTDTEYTVGTTEPETATLDEKTESESDTENTDSHDNESNNTSFETSILRVVTRQQASNNKRQIESDDDSSTSDISVLEEMDEYLDECLAHQEAQKNGPTPPKVNRAGTSPSMTSSSFKYTQGSAYRSPIKVTPSQQRKEKKHVVEGDANIPLMHSVSFYRRQQSQTPNKSTPIRHINRENEIADDKLMAAMANEKREMSLVQDKVKRLMDEVCKQQTIIGQASQALNLCTATVEFSGSREQVEGERLLLLSTHRRQAALNEIQRLKVEGSLRPTVAGASEIQESGALTISAMTLPLKRDSIRNGDVNICRHFLCLVRHLDVIIATPIVQAEPGDSCIRFPSTIKLDDLYSDFKITIEVYSLETQAEILPHEVKYHIHNNGGSSSHFGGSSGSAKKGANKTPKKFLKHESRLVMPCVQSPAGPSAVRSPAFTLSGYVVFSLKEVNRQQFTLNKVPRNSLLEGHLQMHVTCELSVDVEHRGFLTMFEDVSGFGAWHRRWCLLKGDTLSYWKYPDDEKKKTPIGSLELQGVVTTNVGLVSRDICARPHTLLLESVRPSSIDEPDSLVVVRNGTQTRIRHLLSADTKEERLEWSSKFNQTLSLIRAWSGMHTNIA